MKIFLSIISVLILICFLIFFSIWFFISPKYKNVNEKLSNNYYFNNQKTEVHYIPGGNWFEVGDYLLKNVDVKTFEVLSSDYAKDKNNVYFKEILINGADSNSFSIINMNSNCEDLFAKDKNGIYFKNVYLKNSDYFTFEFVKYKKSGSSQCSIKYIKDKNNVYYLPYLEKCVKESCTIDPIKYVDPKTFEAYNEIYAKDKNNVYAKGSIIENADQQTFEVLILSRYAKDKNHVYCVADNTYYAKVLDADPKTFKRTNNGNQIIYGDKDNVYDDFCEKIK